MKRRTYLKSLAGGAVRAPGAAAGAAGTAGLGGCLTTANGDPETTTEGGDSETTTGDAPFSVETVATGLEVPWGVAFGPEGDLYLTERPGRVRRVAVDGEDGGSGENGENRETVADFTDRIAHEGEGGLLGLTFHPDDPDLAYTYGTYDDEGLVNRVVRHRVGDDFAEDAVVVDDIPAASNHDGGRIAFGPEGALYVTTGDAREQSRAQDRDSLAGKVLRVTPDGDPHPDNPAEGDPRVFTFGHRNPQGLAWRDGTLFATEHGPDHDDEINVLRAGENYGWPEVMGPSDREAFTDPVASYTPTIAPASAAFYDGPVEDWRGDFFFGALAGSHLRRVRFDGEEVVEQQSLLDDEYGRLRTVFTGSDDHLYVTTSNRDGRGTPADQDDRVLRIRPA